MGLEQGEKPQAGFAPNANQVQVPLCLEPQVVWGKGWGQTLETDGLGWRPASLSTCCQWKWESSHASLCLGFLIWNKRM